MIKKENQAMSAYLKLATKNTTDICILRLMVMVIFTMKSKSVHRGIFCIFGGDYFE